MNQRQACIDQVLAECDANQLPPLTAAIDPAGDAEHLVYVTTGPEPQTQILRALEQPRRRRLRWPWRQR